MASRTVLGLDTATADVAVAATRGQQTVAERRVGPGEGRPRHAGALLPEVESVVAECGGWGSVELIGVGLGPGSFTGVRVGIATARALGQALGRPLAGVCTLDALALGVAGRAEGSARPTLAVLDARRSQAFALLHDPEGTRLWEPFVAGPAELAERVAALREAPLAGGDGAIRFRRDLERAGAEVLPEGDPGHRLSARQICLLAGEAGESPPDEVRPIYLRPPDAQVWLHRDKRRREGD
jgi:tRNA threonylcarbamoyladenosine biosynthesis protein TsaB